ncbi:MAG: hypothetical protein ABI577_13030 [bacterium]
MNTSRPFLLLRARVKPGASVGFDQWFDAVHVRDVAKIPGIAKVMAGRTSNGTRLGIYSFESTDVVQAALGSPQAAYARGTWERWQPDLEELLIELWASVLPMGIYAGIN